jgi:hypothetical protein
MPSPSFFGTHSVEALVQINWALISGETPVDGVADGIESRK